MATFSFKDPFIDPDSLAYLVYDLVGVDKGGTSSRHGSTAMSLVRMVTGSIPVGANSLGLCSKFDIPETELFNGLMETYSP